ncbi:methyltransferase TYW3-domain-containing protein [Mycotypha africana]|uniref:methyltransferase TYW3-domain-containing protein n=1 Tax=Mycotypha africana TaxID=64632 RepID=UPI002300144E|nr:methyltransferase TYW3-domain-containing protein [Mycotypha africana]KAI8988067.1 methyltransferase TYW3-domain-containing protein [Mycotypha africana]
MSTNKEFNVRKEQVISSLVEYLDPEKRDKSPKGFIDEPILDLMHVINQHPDYYTTSSCSGRVAIYCDGTQQDPENEQRKKRTTKGGTWLYVSHDPIQLPAAMDKDWVLNTIFKNKKVILTTQTAVENVDLEKQRFVYFKFEPLILHIEASSHKTAMQLLNIANQVGYQNSGITPSSHRHMLSIKSTLKIDTPIAYVDEEGEDEEDVFYCFVSPEYLWLLLMMSNQKFEQNIQRMKVFEERMKAELEKKNDEFIETETKEERKQRKKKEGLLLQKQQREQKTQNIETEDVIDTLDSLSLQ